MNCEIETTRQFWIDAPRPWSGEAPVTNSFCVAQQAPDDEDFEDFDDDDFDDEFDDDFEEDFDDDFEEEFDDEDLDEEDFDEEDSDIEEDADDD